LAAVRAVSVTAAAVERGAGDAAGSAPPSAHEDYVARISAADNWRDVVLAVQEMRERDPGTQQAQEACLRAIKSLHGHGRWWELCDAADALEQVSAALARLRCGLAYGAC
jgi:hypothetical protein